MQEHSRPCPTVSCMPLELYTRQGCHVFKSLTCVQVLDVQAVAIVGPRNHVAVCVKCTTACTACLLLYRYTMHHLYSIFLCVEVYSTIIGKMQDIKVTSRRYIETVKCNALMLPIDAQTKGINSMIISRIHTLTASALACCFAPPAANSTSCMQVAEDCHVGGGVDNRARSSQ